MSKKIPWAITIALMLFASALTVVITVSVYMRAYNRLIGDLPSKTSQFAAISEMDELVRANYFGEISSGEVNTAALKGYIDGLHNENCFYLSAEEYKAFSEEMLGFIKGTGIKARFDSEASALVVTGVDKGSPAEENGMELGDRIVSVDAQIVTEENYRSLMERIDGDGQSSVQLRFTKYEDTQENTVSLAKNYKIQSVSFDYENGVGYIKFHGFYEDTPNDFKSALEALLEENVRALILDVRNCESYHFDAACEILDQLVPLATEGTSALMSVRNKNGEILEIFSSDSDSVNLPMAVLINDNTAGAGELLACDLRDFGKAKLVGEKTKGMGLYRSVFPMGDGSALVLTVAEVIPYKSESFHSVGVAPEAEVKMSSFQKLNLDSLAKNQDGQYKAALELLR